MTEDTAKDEERELYCDTIADEFRDLFVAQLRTNDDLWEAWAADGFQVLIGRAGIQMVQFAEMPAKLDEKAPGFYL